MPLNGSCCDLCLLWPVDGGVAVSEGTAFHQILLAMAKEIVRKLERSWGDREAEEIVRQDDIVRQVRQGHRGDRQTR